MKREALTCKPRRTAHNKQQVEHTTINTRHTHTQVPELSRRRYAGLEIPPVRGLRHHEAPGIKSIVGDNLVVNYKRGGCQFKCHAVEVTQHTEDFLLLLFFFLSLSCRRTSDGTGVCFSNLIFQSYFQILSGWRWENEGVAILL